MAISGILKGFLGGDSDKKPQTSGPEMAQRMLPPAEDNKQQKGQIVPVKSSQIVQARPVKVDSKKADVDDTGISPLDSAFAGLAGAVNSLRSVIGEKFKFEKKDNKQKALKRENLLRFLKNKGLAVVGAGMALAKAIDDKTNIFEKMKKFFVNVMIGGLVTYLLKNWEKVVEWWNDTREKLTPILKNLKEWIFDPLWGLMKWVAVEGTKLITNVLSYPPIQNALSEAEKKLGELLGIESDIMGQIPGLKNSLSSLEEKYGSGGPAPPGAQPTVDGTRASGAVTSATAQGQVKKAGFAQSDFELFRDVIAQKESRGRYNIQGGSGDMYAGRYQMGAAARQDAARLLGETYQGDDEAARKKFREDPEMQERYFAAYTRANHGYLTGTPEYDRLTPQGKLQVLAYAHNAGAGNAIKWLKGGRSKSFRDGFNTKSSDYADAVKAAQGGGARPSFPPPAAAPSPSGAAFVNPTPKTNLKTQKGGYAADTGLDIHGKIGDPIVSPVSGTLEYAEEGHTAQSNQDSDPTRPGFQPQHSFRIKLDKPISFGGKTVRFVYGTHLATLDPAVANKSGIKIRQGQLLGTMGQANNVPHLHLGLVGDRAQTEFLNFKEVDKVLGGRYSDKPTATSSYTGAVTAPPAAQESGYERQLRLMQQRMKVTVPIPEDEKPPVVVQSGGAGPNGSGGPTERQMVNSSAIARFHAAMWGN